MHQCVVTMISKTHILSRDAWLRQQRQWSAIMQHEVLLSHTDLQTVRHAQPPHLSHLPPFVLMAVVAMTQLCLCPTLHSLTPPGVTENRGTVFLLSLCDQWAALADAMFHVLRGNGMAKQLFAIKDWLDIMATRSISATLRLSTYLWGLAWRKIEELWRHTVLGGYFAFILQY